MCDHNNVEHLKLTRIQASNGYVKYQCKSCDQNIEKHIQEDVEFNRLYRRHHNLCLDHKEFDISQIPGYLNEEGKKCCNWCGVEL